MRITFNIIVYGILAFSSVALSQQNAGLVFEDARIFLPIKGSTATAGYALIKNESALDVNLTVVEAAPFKAVEIHETFEKDGKMTMQKVEKYVIKSKGQLELKPGANHVMFFEPSHDLKIGEGLPVKFKANEKLIDISFKVIPRVQAPAKK